jgi:hypothetical protein
MRFHKQQWARMAATVLYLLVASVIMVQFLSLLTGGGHQNVSVTLRSHAAADESTEVTIPDPNSDNIPQSQSLSPQAKEQASSASEEWPRLSGVQKAVVFSANANPFYSFYAPITAWAWKHLIGYTPVVLLSEDVHPFVLEKIAVCVQMMKFAWRSACGEICFPNQCKRHGELCREDRWHMARILSSADIVEQR